MNSKTKCNLIAPQLLASTPGWPLPHFTGGKTIAQPSKGFALDEIWLCNLQGFSKKKWN